jgi:arylsulfatase A-like enzyme
MTTHADRSGLNGPPAPPGPPNILLITGDHMRWDTIAGRSVCRTPHVNALVAEGLCFERAYTPVPICCPARAALLTGAYPWHNGVYHQVHVPMSLNPDLAPDVETFSQRLRQVGYRLGYVGKWHASRLRGPLDFGYHEYRAPVQVTLTPEAARRNRVDGYGPTIRDTRRRYEVVRRRSVTWPGGDTHTLWLEIDGEFEATQEYHIATTAAQLIREYAASGRPWHIEVHFPEPHDPYKPLLTFLAQYRPEDVEIPRNYLEETFQNKPRLLAREASLWQELSPEDVREVLRHFYAYCQQVDAAVGIVLDALREVGQVNNTLTVFTADHGDNVGAHRCMVKGWTPYEETIRIPLVARWPGVIPARSRTHALVQLQDLAHTFTAVAGAPALPHADGRDLLPLMMRPEAAEADWPAYRLNCYYGCELLYTQRIAIGQRYKYVFNGFDWDELYDLEADPGEVRNVIDEPAYAEVAQDLRDALWALMFEHYDPYTQLMWGAARYLIGPRGGLPAEKRPWLREHLQTPNHPFVTKQPGRGEGARSEERLARNEGHE